MVLSNERGIGNQSEFDGSSMVKIEMKTSLSLSAEQHLKFQNLLIMERSRIKPEHRIQLIAIRDLQLQVIKVHQQILQLTTEKENYDRKGYAGGGRGQTMTGECGLGEHKISIYDQLAALQAKVKYKTAQMSKVTKERIHYMEACDVSSDRSHMLRVDLETICNEWFT